MPSVLSSTVGFWMKDDNENERLKIMVAPEKEDSSEYDPNQLYLKHDNLGVKMLWTKAHFCVSFQYNTNVTGMYK